MAAPALAQWPGRSSPCGAGPADQGNPATMAPAATDTRRAALAPLWSIRNASDGGAHGDAREDAHAEPGVGPVRFWAGRTSGTRVLPVIRVGALARPAAISAAVVAGSDPDAAAAAVKTPAGCVQLSGPAGCPPAR